MFKKIVSIFCCATVVLSCTACGSSSYDVVTLTTRATSEAEATTEATTAAAATDNGGSTATENVVTLVMAELNPLDTIVGMTDQYFADKVKELSKGSMVIDLKASGALGAENDVLDTMLAPGSTIDLARISAFALTSYGGKNSMLLSLPYTFVSRDHFWNFAMSDLAQEFLLEPHNNGTGVRGLFYAEEGFRHFFTVQEIKGIDDFSGMKIRVSNDPIMNGMVEGLGATPTVVSFGELYSALQSGIVDGAEQPIANYKSNKFPEVANTIILDGHTLGAVQVIMTDEAWDKLTKEQQAIITEAGKQASVYNRSVSQEKEEGVLKELKDANVNVVDVTDKAPWQKAVSSIVNENIKGQEELYNKILNMQ